MPTCAVFTSGWTPDSLFQPWNLYLMNQVESWHDLHMCTQIAVALAPPLSFVDFALVHQVRLFIDGSYDKDTGISSWAVVIVV